MQGQREALYAPGQVNCWAVWARVALDHCLTGMEFAAGIPGSVGGAPGDERGGLWL